MLSESRQGLAKVLGASIVVAAVALAVIPFLTQCADGLKLASGASVPMKCHWTAMAAIATALPLGLVGVATYLTRRVETLRALGILTVALGAMAIALPAVLIGVCANPEHLCNIVMRPAMALTGGLVAAGGLAMIALARGEAEYAG